MHPAYFHTVLDTATPAELGADTPWCVVTAHAPLGATRRFADDAEADRRLRARLLALGAPHWRATGRSPEGDHAEPGFGVVMPLSETKALGREFSQKAIFRIHDGDLWVVACAHDGALLRVGSLAPRLNTPPVPFAGRDTLANLLPAPEKLAALLRFLGPPSDRAASADALLRAADASHASPEDWCAAAAELQNRLETAGRVSPFAKKFGYVSCSAESALATPAALRPPLAETLAAMWETYGYDG